MCHVNNEGLILAPALMVCGGMGVADNKFMILIMTALTISENENVLVFMKYFVCRKIVLNLEFK